MKKYFALFLILWSALCQAAQIEAEPVQSKDLYVGYYRESVKANSGDPTMGSVFLNIPKDDADFTGAMSFNYVGCQSRSITEVSGYKRNDRLRGKWQGEIDNIEEQGDFEGTFTPKRNGYQGTYTVKGGKKLRQVSGCVTYFIGSEGEWALFASEDSDNISIGKGHVTWQGNPADTALTLVSLIDQKEALAEGSDAIVQQSLVWGQSAWCGLPKLEKGRAYIVSIVAFGAENQQHYVGNKTFTAP